MPHEGGPERKRALLTFFADDTDQGGTEASSGTANCLRIFNGALSAVPEPAAAALAAGPAVARS